MIMTHSDKGKYFKKHPKQTKVNDDLKQEVLQAAKENNVACPAAEEIARRKAVALGDVGIALDLLNINIIECQLGLFGYGPQKKIVQPAKEIASDLKQAINDALCDGRLPCAAAWTIAKQLNLPRMKVSSACETLQIKIKPCQLGAF
jgi:hypothetical protein